MCNYFTAKHSNVSTFGYIYIACIAGSPIIYKNGLCGGFISSNYATKSSNYSAQKNILKLAGSNAGTNSSGNSVLLIKGVRKVVDEVNRGRAAVKETAEADVEK
jgi:hypothetical protein